MFGTNRLQLIGFLKAKLFYIVSEPLLSPPSISLGRYLFNDATEGSLRAHLKKENLANGLSSWTSDNSAGAMLWVVFDLTDHGVEEYPQGQKLSSRHRREQAL